ncbi:hypothetical protein CLHUN_20020 [Ruminiclostridium hungatei]|uniref:Uncharacterized protein n=1 Tax=Ruminiclostridium hungatei TaxID=48256 RepID=A0A1V4SK97_RUMHU|nr:hypothetical protein [Ruminiclostridium hungatei]OPX44203.1 hypothetical protein CLHUN_20020 [Ruminiclostridium hungatei]
MRKHYSQVIWGFVLVFININIGFFDILPDFIGYALVAAGLDGLGKECPPFRKGAAPAVIMFFVSLITIFYPSNVFNSEFSPSNIWLLGFPAFCSIVQLIIFYSVCRGIHSKSFGLYQESAAGMDIPPETLTLQEQLEEEYNGDKAAGRRFMKASKNRWYWIAGCTFAELLVLPFMLNVQQWAKPSFMGIIVVKLLAVISLLVLLKDVRNHLQVE